MTPDTLLLRQVHPSWIQQGRISSQVFRPTPKDNKQLSVYDGDRITPVNSWKHFSDQLRFSSAGVIAITKGECEKTILIVIADPLPFPEHVLIDFTPFSENQIKNKAKYLKSYAESRGWLYKVDA